MLAKYYVLTAFKIQIQYAGKSHTVVRLHLHWNQCKFAADLNFESFITLLKLDIRNPHIIFCKNVILIVLFTNL